MVSGLGYLNTNQLVVTIGWLPLYGGRTVSGTVPNRKAPTTKILAESGFCGCCRERRSRGWRPELALSLLQTNLRSPLRLKIAQAAIE
jgi:hypothetical protein